LLNAWPMAWMAWRSSPRFRDRVLTFVDHCTVEL
jgi:hypothetical protein